VAFPQPATSFREAASKREIKLMILSDYRDEGLTVTHGSLEAVDKLLLGATEELLSIEKLYDERVDAADVACRVKPLACLHVPTPKQLNVICCCLALLAVGAELPQHEENEQPILARLQRLQNPFKLVR
jgi:hypothetical protein